MPLHENPIHTPVSLALLGSGTCSKHSNRDSTASISSHSQLSLPCLYKLPSLTLQSSCLSNSGLDIPGLMAAGRWKSAAMPARYIKKKDDRSEICQDGVLTGATI